MIRNVDHGFHTSRIIFSALKSNNVLFFGPSVFFSPFSGRSSGKIVVELLRLAAGQKEKEPEGK